MKTIFKVIVGMIIGATILIVGCAALISSGAKQVQQESDKHAITLHQFHRMHVGMTLTQIRAIAGVHEASADSFQVDESKIGGTTHSGQHCVYFNQLGHLLSIYQVCIDNDSHHVTSTSSL